MNICALLTGPIPSNLDGEYQVVSVVSLISVAFKCPKKFKALSMRTAEVKSGSVATFRFSISQEVVSLRVSPFLRLSSTFNRNDFEDIPILMRKEWHWYLIEQETICI